MRNLRKLGLVAVAILALSGLWAASASAQQRVFEAGSYPAKVSGTQVGESTLTTVKGSIPCSTSLSGEVTSATKVASLALSGYCESFGIKYSFKTSGCNVELTPGWNALGFGPSGCGPITLQQFNCTVTIPSQDGLYTTYANSGGGVTVSLQTSRLRYSGCGAADKEGGGFSATWSLSGISMGAPFEESLFAAEKYSTGLVGSIADEFETEGGNVSCNSATVSGSLSAAVNPLTLSPTYSDCNAFGFLEAAVAMNGCTYAYHLEEEGDNYVQDIKCPAGKSVVITSATCTVAIPAQSGLKSVDYANIGPSPTSRSAIEITSSVTGLTYTVTKDGFLCPFAGLGTRTDGKFRGKTLVEGRDSESRPRNIKIGV